MPVRKATAILALVLLASFLSIAAFSEAKEKRPAKTGINPPAISTDKTVKYDYDIVYVRAPRFGDDKVTAWAEAFNPTHVDSGADLILLHPDGKEELLVAGGEGSIADPYVSFDGEWVYYAKFHNPKLRAPAHGGWLSARGADIYKIHVKTRKIVTLTHQEFTPNTGAVGPKRPAYGVYNIGPCPLPGGKVMFTSNRNGFMPPKGYTKPTLQLFVMDDDGSNVELIGHLNIGSALHPTILRDGRVMFSSYETQGMRDLRLWSVWTIHPDGTNWGPLISDFLSETLFHFMTQISDGTIVAEEYYNLNNSGFGTLYKLPAQPKDGYAPFGSAYPGDPRNRRLPSQYMSLPFSPFGFEALTPFVTAHDVAAPPSVPGDKNSPRVGKFTHPSGAPDNHLLTVWTPGPANHNNGLKRPAVDGGIYLIKSGKPISSPNEMLLIKNDPKYNEQWPRALVPYKRIFGVDEPTRLKPLANDGKRSPHLPEGTPFGLVGTSSLYKRESYPNGTIPKNGVTAVYAGGTNPYQGLERFFDGQNPNWLFQGSDAGRYKNEDIHAIRILAMEPTTDRGVGNHLFLNIANERLRILGEFPVRKFAGNVQPKDPDGNPDTSFLAKIPADVAWTFQTLDKEGMVLNMAQTWHQLRPGEIRHDCGGCHAHSQQPTLFEKTAAAKPDYKVWDLTKRAPLLTGKDKDESGQKWDAKNEVGVRYHEGIKNVEYYRDVKPIFQRSCVACHTQKSAKPAGNLVLDDDKPVKNVNLNASQLAAADRPVPGTYVRLANDRTGKFGYKPIQKAWRFPQVSRYLRMFQSRRSLLMWKVHGKRTDGWSNDDFPTETVPGDPKTLQKKGKSVPNTPQNRNLADLDFTGSVMPPAKAVAGTYVGPDGKKIKVAPLTDEDRRTLARWIDLGCPIDLDFKAGQPASRGYGWMLDDNRPTLALTYPRAGGNEEVTRFLVGMHDYYTGLDLKSFHVVADFPIAGVPAGKNLADKFKAKGDGVWELKLDKSVTGSTRRKLTVAVRDKQGNVTRIERTFWIASANRNGSAKVANPKNASAKRR
jgi:hypothetical protein